MGAALHARENDSLPPLTVVGRTPLRAIDYTTPVPSAQVKSAILLAGLRAEGRTTVRESVATRDHTERMLRARGVPVERADGAGRGRGLDGSEEGWRCRRSTSGSRATSPRRRSGSSRAPIHPDAELGPARRRRQPDPPRGHRPPARDGRRHRGAAARSAARTTASASRSPTCVVRSSTLHGRRARPGRRGRGDRRDPGPVPGGRRGRRARPSSAAPASCATRNPTGSPGSRPGLRALGARIEVDGDDLRIDGGAAPARRRDRQPRRPPPGDDLRHRRARRRRRRPRSGGPARRRSPIPASSTTSKGCEHDEARRPHRPPRGPFAVRRDAAGRLRLARHRRDATSCGTAPRSTLADAIAELRERRLPGRQRHDPAQGAGRADGRPPDRGGPRHRARSTRSPARASGSSATTRTCPASRSPSTGSSASRRCRGQAVVLGAGGGARAVVYGLITEGFQRIIVFNRHLHRAEGLVKHFGRSAAHMELRAMPWHESIIESELAKTQGPRQRDLDRADQRREPDPGRGAPRRPAGARPHLRQDPPAARRGGGRLPRSPTAS